MTSLGGSGLVWTRATSLVYSVVLGERVGRVVFERMGDFSIFW